MKTVTIMRGISGSGKSTYIKKNFDSSAVICSADHFFIDSSGDYKFDPSKLGAAHSKCKQKFKDALESGVTAIVVDNTNTMLKEMKLYVELALFFNYKVNIVRLEAPVDVCAKRNAHGVPSEVVQRMSDRMQDIPVWWNIEEVVIV